MTAKLIAVVLLFTPLAGCASLPTAPAGTQSGGAATAPLPDLPRPGALLQQLHPGGHAASLAKFTEADVEQLGIMHDPALPYQHVADNGTALRFIPNLADPGAGVFDGLSFATYHFELHFYDRNPEVRLKWKVAPQSAGGYFVAAANWTKDRWDWKPGTDDGRISLGTMSPYISFSDDILVLVAKIGTEDAQLDSVRIGGLPPVASLSVAESIGAVPFTPKLDASGSTDPDGLELTYQFDFDGDGIFESIPGSDPTAEYNYSANGDYQPAVKVTNTIHASSVASIELHALSDWSRSFGAAGSEDFTDVTVDANGYIYAVGVYDVPQENVMLTKWTPAGDLVWAKEWDSGENDYGVSLDLNINGDLIIGGQTNKNGVRQALVQKYTTDGVKVWSTSFGDSSETTSLMEIGVTMDAIYCGGMTDVNSNTDLFAAKLDLDGNLLWSTYRDTGAIDVFDDMVLSYSNFGGDYGVALLAESQIGGNSNLWKVRIDDTGAYVSSHQLGTSAQPKNWGKFVFLNDFLEGAQYYVCGETKISGQYQFFMLKTNFDGNNVWGKRFPSLDIEPRFLGINSDGRLVAGCSGTPTGSGMTMFKETTGGVDLGLYTLTSPSNSVTFYGMRNFAGGILFAGQNPNSTTVPGHPSLGAPSSFYEGWNTLGTTGGSASFSSQDTPAGVMTDVTASGVLNTGGGGYDGVLTWRKGV